MDIGNIAAAETGFLHLVHPATGQKLVTEDGAPIGLELSGMYSKAWRNKLNRLANSKMGGKQKTTAERSFEEMTELLAAVTAVVKNLVVDGVEYTPKNIAELYASVKHGWIRKQVDEFIGDDANFFTASDNS